MTSYGLKQRFSSVVVYVFLGVMAFLSVFPFLWMVIGATNTTSDVIKGKMSFGEALFLNATTFFTQVNVPLIFWNSAKITIIATVAQVISNLLNNAGKFTEEGEIRFGFDMKDGCVEFFVQDTGMGIPPEKARNIFDRFVKLNDFAAGSDLSTDRLR